MKAQDAAAANPFASAREQFERIVRDLESEPTCSMTHGDHEEHLRVQGFELLRRLFQGHLDARRRPSRRVIHNHRPVHESGSTPVNQQQGEQHYSAQLEHRADCLHRPPLLSMPRPAGR
jgi:hypothetical protein